ncbi:MAG TPA: copper amine oxidase N-terminal domain-containing protein [Candidatus Sulfotelmatobacter sp.]|nr:copper amine oxidase N-terminal domain-containing protein [Candidatus Sulfotelmatobacter sp.]
MHAWLSRLTVTLVALLFCGSAASAQTTAPAESDFGHAPSGEIPILYNDHTVYAKPDVLKRGRVLAALVQDNRLFVPLRSMFEAMGATVSASADGLTVTAQKPGAMISVTVGKNEVVVNGESRPLDVAPIVYHGIVLVPVRVISEAMGAYVQWVPGQRVVVVRYLPTPVAPPPAPVPTAVPVASPPPTPIPSPVPTPITAPSPYGGFIEAAVSDTQTFNEFSDGLRCPQSYDVAAAYAFGPRSPFAVKVDYHQDVYGTTSSVVDAYGNHYTGFATIDGGYAFTPEFVARQSTLDGRIEYQVAAPRIYVGIGYLHTANNYGYPQLNGVGFGVEKLPELRTGVSFFGSAFYYPSATGTYTISNPASPNVGISYRQQYAITKYDVGLALVANHFPVYLYGGFSGDEYRARAYAPINQLHDGPYAGLGVKL